ncbi:MAG: Mrp/NBP35 family ATP-binding protein [Acholeplasmatales bacterium]|nr:Mrp/NBP35 family ATP-binding protein [Acholeplasmatales bacterium]
MSCTHNCDSCGSKGACGEIKKFLAKGGIIKHIIGVMSGKGGVGKSTVTSLLANEFRKKGYRVGILDADITGPSIPHSFGVSGKLDVDNNKLFLPKISKGGIKIVSTNLVLEDPEAPVLWRGPILGSAVEQFYDQTKWETLDYLFVDMPPGTSDVALTVFQSVPLDGVVMVTSPQELVSMVVAKALNMAKKMNVKVIGLVENMSYVLCPDCGKHIEIYGKSHLNNVCEEFHLIPLGRLPIDPILTNAMDNGDIESYKTNALDVAVLQIEGNC